MTQENSKRSVVIVGGGIAGVASFISIIRFETAASIDIIDPLGVGKGIAFSTKKIELLCNTSVDTMSLLDDDQNDFLRYLHDEGIAAKKDHFVPRKYVSNYVKSRYIQYCAHAKAIGIEHRYIKASAQSISKISNGTYRVELDNGLASVGSDVLICTGNGSPFQPETVRAHLGCTGLFGSLYPEQNVLESLSPHSKVLVLGSRLSAIDSALLLCKSGHRVLLASPSGQLPAVRTATPRMRIPSIDQTAFELLNLTHPHFYFHLLRRIARAANSVHGRPLKKQVARSDLVAVKLHQEISLASHDMCDWQEVIIPFMDLAESTWKDVPVELQRIAILNCNPIINRYLFAIPLKTARKILGYINTSLLRVISAQISSIRYKKGWVVEWTDEQSETFDAIVCATGFQKPQWRVSAETLLFCKESLTNDKQLQITPDLRVFFEIISQPERIWTIGVASNLAAPVVNSVYQTVRQAYRICQGWCTPSNTSKVINPERLIP